MELCLKVITQQWTLNTYMKTDSHSHDLRTNETPHGSSRLNSKNGVTNTYFTVSVFFCVRLRWVRWHNNACLWFRCWWSWSTTRLHIVYIHIHRMLIGSGKRWLAWSSWDWTRWASTPKLAASWGFGHVVQRKISRTRVPNRTMVPIPQASSP